MFRKCSVNVSHKIVLISISVAFIPVLLWLVSRKRKSKPQSRVSELFIYPIKSLGGIQVGILEVNPDGAKYGLIHDRAMILIDSESRMITQRQQPRLAQVQMSITGPDEVTAIAEGYEPCKVKLRTEMNEGEESIKFIVWNNATEGIEVSRESSEWFSTYLDKPGTKLVQHISGLRMRPSKVAGELGQFYDSNHQIRYQDNNPVHLTSDDTLNELNRNLEVDQKMNQKNFRPNIVIRGSNPRDEEVWKYVTINELVMKQSKLCDRCLIPLIDIEKAKKNEYRDQILKRFRSAKDEIEKKNYESRSLFGVQLLPINSGYISIGSNVFGS